MLEFYESMLPSRRLALRRNVFKWD